VKYEKYRSISILYPIDYQYKKRYGIPPETLIIRGSQDHALVGPLENQPLMICFIGGFLFWAKFGPGFEFFEGKQG
jgi:hypothetical protein